VAGVRLRAPMMSIHTVAAGGGSILHFDGARLPGRAGQRPAPNPGPACYRRGGPLTVTDANVDARQDAAGAFPGGLRPAAPTSRWTREAVRGEVRGAWPPRCRPSDRAAARSAEALAEGFMRIAVANMANAIKQISVQRGYDVTRIHAARCFGGAGGQHACLVADALGDGAGVRRTRWPACCAAYGMGLADQTCRCASSAVELLLDDAVALDAGARWPSASPTAARGRARATRARPRAIRAARRLHLRYQGTETALIVDLAEPHDGARPPSPRPHRAALRLPDARSGR
jgi:5-oxoprolinase (ATP-hydrolysing)